MLRQLSTVVLLFLAVLGSLAVVTADESKEAGGKAKSPPKELTVDLGKGVKLELVLIPAGEFLMGSPDSDKDAFKWEKPQHRVRITKPFYLGKYLVTQEQWEAVMGNNPSYFKGGRGKPVEQVSWDDCQRFIARLNEKVGGGKFQLPSEAQWEYACRAGSKTRYSFGDDKSKLGEYAWYGATRAPTLILWARRSRTLGGCMTCTGTYGSGVRIRFRTDTTLSHRWTIRRGLPQARPARIAAVAGTARRGATGRRSATSSSTGFATTPWACVSPEFRRTSKASERSRCAAGAQSRSAAGRDKLGKHRRSERTTRQGALGVQGRASVKFWCTY